MSDVGIFKTGDIVKLTLLDDELELSVKSNKATIKYTQIKDVAWRRMQDRKRAIYARSVGVKSDLAASASTVVTRMSITYLAKNGARKTIWLDDQNMYGHGHALAKELAKRAGVDHKDTNIEL